LSEKNYYAADEFDGLAEAGGESGIFRKFKSKRVAAREWIKDLIANGYRSGDRRTRRALADEGLFLSDEMQEVGVLSIAPSLSALLLEISLLEDEKEEGAEGVTFAEMLTEGKPSTLNVIVNSVCKLLAECFPSGVKSGGRILLSSMPFYDDTTATEGLRWDTGGYLDSASWVFLAADSVESFLARMKRVAPEEYAKIKWEIKGDRVYTADETLSAEEVEKAVRALYLECIRITCDCIVRRDGKVAGWSFRKMSGAEPSLYFSYVASTVYLGLFKRFDCGADIVGKLRRFEKQLSASGDTVAHFKFYHGLTNPASLEKTVQRLKRDGFDEFADFLSNLSADSLKELDLLYNAINAGQQLTYRADEDGADGAFTVLKEASVSLAESLWNEGFGNLKTKTPFKVNMSKGPCYEDGTLVDMDTVRLSSHNNAFFNNLFVIGIILNSAYDYELSVNDPEEYEKMLNTFQIAIQNTQRCYNEIENEGLLYKIDSYILDFSDKVDDTNSELAKQLRKVNIAAVPLLPLMLKNNNLMSQYVVQYPQKQMKESLKDIIRNKKRKGGESSWVWDKDGFNAITNYYYIDALISFYRYYEQYEEPFIDSERNRRRQEKKAAQAEREKYENVLSAAHKKHAEEIAWRDEYIERTRKLFRDIAGFVANGLIDLIDDQLTADNLLANLEAGERSNREKVIDKLNSFDKDTDAVKLTKLVHLTEKLQLLSLLSMEYNPQLVAFLKNGDPEDRKDAHSTIIRNVFGAEGDSSKFMRNLITYLTAKVPSNKE